MTDERLLAIAIYLKDIIYFAKLVADVVSRSGTPEVALVTTVFLSRPSNGPLNLTSGGLDFRLRSEELTFIGLVPRSTACLHGSP